MLPGFNAKTIILADTFSRLTFKLLTDYSEVRVAGKYTKVFSDENMEQVRHKHEKSSSKIIVVRGN